MKHYVGFVILVSGLLLAHCSSSDDDGGPSGQQQTLERGLFGTVVDSRGAPIPGVTVEVNGVTATTDASGEFAVETSAGRTVARFGADGYLPTVRKVAVADGSPTAAHVVLKERALAQSVSADASSMVEGERQAAVMIEPETLIRPGESTPVTGIVDVFLTPVDPSVAEEVQALTGSFEDGQDLLESFGMLEITIVQGEDVLEVAPGESLPVRIPAPAGANPAELPSDMPLWSLNEETGQWEEESTATYDAATNAYVGEISHMSAWNVDLRTEGTCITGLALDPNGDPIAGAEVDARGLDYFGSSAATTEDDGRFYIPVRKSSRVSVSVSHEFGGGEIREVTSGSGDTDIPPTRGDPRCLDIGTFTVARDVVILSDGTTVACDDSALEAFFTGTCAERFGDIFTCWNPQGGCTFTGTGVSYDNGAELTTDLSGRGQFINSSGEVCGTFTTNLDAANPTIDFITASGETFRYITDLDSGDFTIVCPGGQTVTLTTEEQQALQACTGDDSGGECSGDVGPIEGACTNDSECTDFGGVDWVCCDFGEGLRSCLPAESCAAI